MYQNKRVIVVMPAYNAERTLRKTYDEVMEQGIVDYVILVDDHSNDNTIEIAGSLPRTIIHRHPTNMGYGANQKTCYDLALKSGADIVIMVHPDYQYTPKLIPAMASMIGNGLYECVLGSRILTGQALTGGMPLYKYVANRVLTFTENLLTGAKLSEYHTGYRAFSRDILLSVPYHDNSDDFIFDNQMLAQILMQGHKIGEVSCPAKYFPDASSINFRRSLRYGLGCLATALHFRLEKSGLMGKRFALLKPVPTSSIGVHIHKAKA